MCHPCIQRKILTFKIPEPNLWSKCSMNKYSEYSCWNLSNNLRYYKKWTKNSDVVTFKMLEKLKNQKIQKLEIIETKQKMWLHNMKI